MFDQVFSLNPDYVFFISLPLLAVLVCVIPWIFGKFAMAVLESITK